MTSGRRSRASRRASVAPPPPRRPLANGLRTLLVIGASWYVAAYLGVALLRISYPFELEWLEGAALQLVRRVLAGQPIYVAPSVAFVGLNYTPLYFQVSAAFARVVGTGFLALRLVSFAASIAIFALLFDVVRRETRSRSAAWLAVGLFAAAYRLGGAWLDVARSDALYLAFVLAGAWALRADPQPSRSALLGALAFALAFATKQSAVVVVAPLLLWLLIRDPRRGVPLAVSVALAILGTVLVLDAQSGGWFRYYVFGAARRFAMSPSLFWLFPLHDLRPFIPILAAIAWMIARPRVRPPLDTMGFFGALGLGLFASAWQLRLYRGGYDNVLMTAHLALAMVAAVAWAQVSRSASGTLRVVVSAVMLLQLALLWWNPASQVPTAADRAANQRLLDGLRTLPGRVFVSSHSYLAVTAGKPDHAHVAPFMDVVKGSKAAVESGLLRAMRDTLAAHAYPVLVMDNRDWLLEEALLADYLVRGRVFADPAVAWPVTGMRTRPEYVLTPRTPADSAVARPRR